MPVFRTHCNLYKCLHASDKSCKCHIQSFSTAYFSKFFLAVFSRHEKGWRPWAYAVDLQRDGNTQGSLLEFQGVLRSVQWEQGLVVRLLGAKEGRPPAVCDKECYCFSWLFLRPPGWSTARRNEQKPHTPSSEGIFKRGNLYQRVSPGVLGEGHFSGQYLSEIGFFLRIAKLLNYILTLRCVSGVLNTELCI